MSLFYTFRTIKYLTSRELVILVRSFSMNSRAPKRGNEKRTKDHYSTLKVTPNATQNEIKSAYYKLTMRYHPDRNQSESAKEKFQDISNAYAVLGNHDSRKKYDRAMLIRQGNEFFTGKRDRFSKSPNSQTMNRNFEQPERGFAHMYDIDKWTQAHYEYAFNHARNMKMKADTYEANKKTMYKDVEQQMTSARRVILYSTLALSVIIFFILPPVYGFTNYDEDKTNSK